MKLKINQAKILVALTAFMMGCLLTLNGRVFAQDSTAARSDAPVAVKIKPVKNTFQSVWISDNQTVMVPIKGTFEMDIQHRFGVLNKGYEDFWGFFAPSNIRLGVSYVPINKLNLGIGVTKTTATIIPELSPSSVPGPLWDGSVKYSIITQTKGKYPVSVTYYGNAAFNTYKLTLFHLGLFHEDSNSIYKHTTDRLSYFHQLIIARKVNDKLSVQIAPSLSHHNLVNGYFVQLDSAHLKVKPDMKFDQFSIAFSGRYKLTDVTSLIINYDQPITKHVANNPNPSLSFGVEFNTSSHSFQLFFTNFYYLNPQTNNLYNTNNPFEYDDMTKTHPVRFKDDPNTTKDESVRVKGGRFLIGFNITRLWNY